MSQYSSQKQVFGLMAWLLLCFAASAIGAVASINAPAFYGQLVQPSWAPPAWLFGPVWTVLYALMAISVWLVWRQGGFRDNRNALLLFLCQLALNAFWSWLFFSWQLGMWSFVDIVILWVLIFLTILKFGRVNVVSGVLLLPYLMWVSFAAALNFTIWRLNPAVLG